MPNNGVKVKSYQNFQKDLLKFANTFNSTKQKLPNDLSTGTGCSRSHAALIR